MSWFPSLMRPAKCAGTVALTLGLLALTAAATRADARRAASMAAIVPKAPAANTHG